MNIENFYPASVFLKLSFYQLAGTCTPLTLLSKEPTVQVSGIPQKRDFDLLSKALIHK